jgi:SapC
MSKQLLIYESVVPLSAARHGDCSVEIGGQYAFSGEVNSVPLMAVEFPYAAAEYAMVFAGNDGNLMPAVILGVRGNENLYVSKENIWEAKYIPAFVRRYPFVFSTSPDGKRLILCIDEAFAGFNREGHGQRLFGDDGKPTPYVDNVLKFLQEYQAQFRRTQAFCAEVRELQLLEPMQAQVDLASGERLALSGFMAVNRAKLKAVPGEKLAELAQSDGLELLFLHLQSMRNFSNLRDRLAVIEGGKATPATEGAAAPGDDAAGSPDGDGDDGRVAAE